MSSQLDTGPSADRPRTLTEAVDRTLDLLRETQAEDGSWEGDYGGPLFLLPLYVATLYIVAQTESLPEAVRLTDADREGVRRYILGHQNADGGWGLHVEGHSLVYTTAANYVALRLLGASPGATELTGARSWLRSHGGPVRSAPWGKFLLALLGLLPYRGMLPVPPETWLLPRWLPVHPGRLWCHTRMVYLPMAYLYGTRATARSDATLDALRGELYGESWGDIDWSRTRTSVAGTDTYVPLNRPFRAVSALLSAYERRHSRALRERALDEVLEQVDREDRNTDYICLGPINKLLNTLCWYFARPGGDELSAHLERLPEYLWHAPDGIKMQGYQSSKLWDTALTVRAVSATGRRQQCRGMLREAHAYVDASQIREEVPGRRACYRGRSKGGWPFSSRAHGWPITDCTALGLEASLDLQPVVPDPLGRQRLEQAVEHILAMQNDDGGWATYERTRGPEWLERLNPAVCFGDIMIDYSFVECTSACVQALSAFEEHRSRSSGQVRRATERGLDFILSEQRDDGSWYGSWGVCFTYGTWFAVEGLRAAGLDRDHAAVQRAARFLLEKQLPDGGWGETPESCRRKEYVHAERSQAVMTSWALLTLVRAGHRPSDAVERGVRFLLQRQREDGSWTDDHLAGVFNRTCAINYDNYSTLFPLWALARAGALPERDGAGEPG